jgi:hypothetical protein
LDSRQFPRIPAKSRQFSPPFLKIMKGKLADFEQTKSITDKTVARNFYSIARTLTTHETLALPQSINPAIHEIRPPGS